jgi:hypothetical protein
VLGVRWLPSPAHVLSVLPAPLPVHIVELGMHVLQRETVLPLSIPQPLPHTVIVVPLPSAAHVKSVGPAHEVLFGVHVLQRAAPPAASIPHPCVHAALIAELPSAAQVMSSVLDALHITDDGTHVLQRIAVALQPGAPHGVDVVPLPAALHVTASPELEHIKNALAVQWKLFASTFASAFASPMFASAAFASAAPASLVFASNGRFMSGAPAS